VPVEPAVRRRPLSELPTPALLVDRARLQTNIATTARDLLGAGLTLRPHWKTSKSLEVAQRQLDAGAVGLTCATPAEVTALGAAGVRGLLWAHLPVGPAKVAFAVEAAARYGLTVALDSVEAGAPLSAAAAAAGRTVPFLLEVDSGLHRSGVDPDRALDTASRLAAFKGLRLDGVMTHEGQLYAHGPDRAALEGAGRAVGKVMVEVADDLRRAGLSCDTVSVGSTPGLTSTPYAAGVTEARPGTYVYYDANQLRLGSTTLDHCALTVLTRVVSRQRDGIAITDAGTKAMSSDSASAGNGVGLVCDLAMVPMDGIHFTTANEEHGFMHGAGVSSLVVGDVLRIVPNHACATVNMWSSVGVVEGDTAVDRWPVLARH